MNQPQILISIIVPVYNGELYLSACLESLVGQSLQAIEIVVIDDASTDQTPEIISRFAAHDSRIKPLRNTTTQRQGISRNLGISAARGEYIAFVDADDWIDITFFEKLYHAAKAADAMIAKAEALIVHQDGTMEPFSKMNDKIRKGLRDEEPLAAHFRYEFWTGIYLRSALVQNKIEFPDIRNGEDLVFLMQATYHLNKFVLVPEVYYYYRQHAGSTEAVREEAYYESILQSAKIMLKYLFEQQHTPEHKKMLLSNVIKHLMLRQRELEQRPEMTKYGEQFAQKGLCLLIQVDIPPINMLHTIQEGYFLQRNLQQLKRSRRYRIGSLITHIPRIVLKSLYRKKIS